LVKNHDSYLQKHGKEITENCVFQLKAQKGGEKRRKPQKKTQESWTIMQILTTRMEKGSRSRTGGSEIRNFMGQAREATV